jgi:hypothetical protein
MKSILLTIKTTLLFVVSATICGCGCDSEKEMYQTAEIASKYQMNTRIESFKMVDSYGMTDKFYIGNYDNRITLVYTGTLYSANYRTVGADYMSTLNGYFFTFTIAISDNVILNMGWNRRNGFEYDFITGKVSGNIVPVVSFYDSLTVKGVTYQDIIEVDYSNRISDIDNNTPVKTYISGAIGLIKFIRKDGVVAERIADDTYFTNPTTIHYEKVD